MKSCPGTYYIIVVEDTELAKIVACGTLFIEQKFIHEIAIVCIFILMWSQYYCCGTLQLNFHLSSQALGAGRWAVNLEISQKLA